MTGEDPDIARDRSAASRAKSSVPLLLAAASIAALSFAAISDNEKVIFYNATPSAPRGWYLRVSLQDVRPGQLVLVKLPDAVAAMAAGRRYLPRDVPALKIVAAIGGDEVCERNGTLRINGWIMAKALTQDAGGRRLVAWEGCERLRPDEVFLLNTRHRASFDSRYYGPIPRAAVLGGAIPLWTEEEA